MIVYPKEWRKHYEELSVPIKHVKFNVKEYVDILRKVLINIDVRHLAYSGGIDSTILLHLLTDIHGEIFTYTISSREDHPDVLFARFGNEFYNSSAMEFIVNPTHKESDGFGGDNAVRQLFEEVSLYTNEIITGDGIDEFMCGYYKHTDVSQETYEYYLSRLLSNHLMPLNSISMYTNVFLPYLDDEIVCMNRNIKLQDKVDSKNRKKLIVKIAEYLGVPNEIIERNKYGFCDAFRERNK